MLFNSSEFLIFFPCVTALYFLLPHRARWAVLLASSCLFYMAFIPAYVLILGVTILVDYAAGIWIEGAEGPARRRILIISILSNVGFLFFFKYFNFFNENAASLARFLDWRYPVRGLEIILPIGLSFHTFQAMSYTIEVYRGNQRAERHLGIYALYVMFYPQLVAGPIERPQNLLHQFRERHDFDAARVTAGLQLMLWGLFKKVVIADRLAVGVNLVFANPTKFTGLTLLFATFFFAFQIYCDFSGYSDIAVGAAQVMGFRLMENFRRPYLARSMAEFWKRWHISLSTWFKDYLYVSIGGNRVPVHRWYFNLMVVFLVSGLWHGANWTFVVWGALHGFYLVFGLAAEKLRSRFRRAGAPGDGPRLPAPLRMAATFVLVCIGWVFFRADSLSDAIYILTHCTQGLGSMSCRELVDSLFRSGSEFFLSMALIAFLMAVDIVRERCGDLREVVGRFPPPVRWAVYEGGILAVIFLGVFKSGQFIYFQF